MEASEHRLCEIYFKKSADFHLVYNMTGLRTKRFAGLFLIFIISCTTSRATNKTGEFFFFKTRTPQRDEVRLQLHEEEVVVVCGKAEFMLESPGRCRFTSPRPGSCDVGAEYNAVSSCVVTTFSTNKKERRISRISQDLHRSHPHTICSSSSKIIRCCEHKPGLLSRFALIEA